MIRPTTDTARIAEAIAAAGFNPVPAVDQVWHHRTVDYLPEGQRRLVRITGLYKVEAGWSATVQAWIDGAPCPADHEMGDGVIFLKTLVAEYTLIEAATR
ncbi:MAG: hypothetical protein JWO67_155 [Streptosporangiaceae bacterium]|jgi:hypothetical protein|nr:hypothetical protein [Streptosporangiaceae bacterium]